MGGQRGGAIEPPLSPLARLLLLLDNKKLTPGTRIVIKTDRERRDADASANEPPHCVYMSKAGVPDARPVKLYHIIRICKIVNCPHGKMIYSHVIVSVVINICILPFKIYI